MTENGAISEQQWIEWKRKRKQTLAGFILVGAVVGIDYSVVLATLYLYLKNVIKPDNPEIWYGVITAIFSLSSTISGLIAGRWVDKTRKIRTYLNIIFLIQILGSLLYTIPYSAAFPFFGRLLVGIGDPFINVCSGEVIRINDTEGGLKALWYIATTYSIGFIVGPAVNLMFKGINFHIGPMHVTYLNFVGLFMSFLLVCALIVSNTLIHNCSLELDLKEYIKKNRYPPDQLFKFTEDVMIHRSSNNTEEDTPLLDNNDDDSVNIEDMPWQNVVFSLCTNIDTVLMFLSTFIFMYALFSSDVLLPLLCLKTFKWDIAALTYIFIAYGAVYFFVILIMSSFCKTAKGVYYSTLLCTGFQIIQFSVLVGISQIERNKERDMALMGLYLLFWLFVWCVEEVLLRSLVSRMVPSKIQSFTESIRAGVARVSTILGGLTTPMIFPYLEWWSFGLIIVTIILLFCFVVRKGSLIKPQEISFLKT